MSAEESGMSRETEPMVPCPNCEGEGFLLDAATEGRTTPCPVCLTEEEVRESDAVQISKDGLPKPGVPRPPWES